jgi:protein tyrosine phosphatase (PTP) superfamily phosphohydrolase (DUF442 family)
MLKHELHLPNQCTPTPDLLTCGLPAPQELKQAQAAGYKTVINLCQPQETPRDEPATVQALGMHYFNIPVAGPGDLTEAKARQLGEVVNNCDHHPVLIHCMSGNRVGALLALKAFFVDGKTPREALDAGRAAGLKALEPEVWRLLSQHAAKA